MRMTRRQAVARLGIGPAALLAAPGAARSEVYDLRELLERVEYDPAREGPLLAVAPGPFTPERPLPPMKRRVPSLRVVAAAGPGASSAA
ncbi:MAG TPA: hypothetical protein VM490_00365, partial [Armatimonadaceae bacterium]|nr:hypothetical protein [Armatimonadaceae bacterium]